MDDLDPQEVEGRVVFLQNLLRKYRAPDTGSKKRSQLSSGNSGSLHELSSLACEEDSQLSKHNRKFLNKQDVDLLFPTQQKSYYASAEL